jgi:hypothetical protein
MQSMERSDDIEMASAGKKGAKAGSPSGRGHRDGPSPTERQASASHHDHGPRATDISFAE